MAALEGMGPITTHRLLLVLLVKYQAQTTEEQAVQAVQLVLAAQAVHQAMEITSRLAVGLVQQEMR